MASQETLAKDKVGFGQMVGLGVGGVCLYCYAYATAGGFIATAGSAAIWVGILGLIVVLAVSIPVLEYTRLVNFSGGYYGLAELGFGRAVGKFTAFINYLYYNFWQLGNASITGMLMVVGYYIITGHLPAEWIFYLVIISGAILMFVGATVEVKLGTRLILVVQIITMAIVLGAALYVIFKTPFNSLAFVSPSSGTGGFRGIALGASIAGFLTFIGYGNALFYSEEGSRSRSIVWKSILVSLVILVAIGSVSIYSEVAALSSVSTVENSAIPLLTAYGPYFGTIGLFIFWGIFIPIYYVGLMGGAGAQARLLYAMSRDGFIKSKWLKQLHTRRKVPIHAAIVNFIIALVSIVTTSTVLFHVYGYNENTMFYVGFAPFTTAVILWYFHHFIPDISLGFYVHKHKLKVSPLRFVFTAIIAPAIGVFFFSYAFYLGILSNAVEPYFAFVITAFVLVLAAVVYVAYKAAKNQLGESVIETFATEAELGGKK